jgi:hypothetical protein
MDEIGAQRVVETMGRLEAKWGLRFKDAPYIVRAARENKAFCS